MHAFKSLTALGLTGVVAGSGHAAILNVTAENRVDDRQTFGVPDTNDGLPGNVRLFVGDASSTSLPTIFATILEFDISANRADILNAASVVLRIERTGTIGDLLPSFDVIDMIDADENGGVQETDVDGGSLITNISGGAFFTTVDGDFYEIDVTAAAKADALNLGNDFTGFRFEAPGLTLVSPNNVANVIEFELGTAVLETSGVIPEPASLGLLGVGGLLIAGRRRRA